MSYKRLDNDQCFRDLDPYFKGLDENDDGTFGCDGYPGCLYLQNGRCIYNIAPIKRRCQEAVMKTIGWLILKQQTILLMGINLE